MAQHDYVIANASGATVRADINNMALAISSNNSGSSEPSTTYAYLWWLDTSANVLKLRNSANNAWITMPFSIGANNTVDINGGAIDGTPIGASAASTGAFTTLNASGAITGTLATAAQPNITSVGTLTGFTSTGIDDNADATAITIDSSERVGINNSVMSSMDSGKNNLVVGSGSGGQGMTIYSANNAFGTIAFADGTSGDDKYRGLVTYSHSADSLDFYTNATEKMTILTDGKVGIGTTSPDALLTVGSTSNSGPELQIMSSTSGTGYLYFGDGTSGTDRYDGFIGYNQHTSYMVFATGGGNERMRINSSGQLLLGTTSNNSDSYKMIADLGGGAKGIDVRGISYNANNGAFRSVPSGNTTYLFAAMLNSSNSTVGSIVVTSSNTTYNTSSDYRLKENVKPLENGLDRLNQLKPVKFNWIESGQEEEGFIAHEVKEVFPYAVTGEKDAVNEEGKIQGQQMDYGRITPLLVKAIQEQQEQIEQLKTEIQTLKGE